MITALVNIIIVLVVFSVLIIIHELGHFLAARLFGVRVTDFSIGFGPPIVKKKIKKTNLLICLFPLGGYIKMAGDSRLESKGYKDEFFSKAPGARAAIVFAGPLFNYILAFLMLVTIATVGFPVQDTVVGAVKDGSPAQTYIQSGDKIITIDNRKVQSWSELQNQIQEAKGWVEVVVIRNGNEINFNIPLEKKEIIDRLGRTIEVSQIGIVPYGPVIGEVIDGYPAKKAGLQKGDEIIAINSKKIKTWEELAQNIQDSKKDVLLKVKRGKKAFSLKVPIQKEEINGIESKKKEISVIGIRPPLKDKILKISFPASILKGGEMLFQTTALSIKGLWYMITDPSISVRDSVAGPIYISYIISKTAKLGLVALLQLMSLLSIFLFIINLLPIPVFDGGHIFFFGIERLRKKPLSQKTEDAANRIGLALIILLMFFVFYNDIVKRGPRIWEDIKNSFSQKEANKSKNGEKLENNNEKN